MERTRKCDLDLVELEYKFEVEKVKQVSENAEADKIICHENVTNSSDLFNLKSHRLLTIN